MSKTSRTLAFALGALALVPASILADGPKFTGYVTATYGHDFSDTAVGNSYYGNSQGNGFLLNAAHLTIAGGDSAGATYGIDIDAGTDGSHNTNPLVSSHGSSIDIQQAFLTIPILKSPVSITGGKFYTSEGIEVLNSGANPTVTRGLLFGQLEPVATTGAYLTFKASDALSVSLGGVNGWDNWTVSDVDGVPTVYAKVALGFGNPFSGTISAYYGPEANTAFGPVNPREKFISLDLTGVNKSVDNLAINFQVNYLSLSKFSYNDDGELKDFTGLGFGIQPVYTIGAGQIGARYEYLSKDPGYGKATTVHSISVAPGYRLTQATLARIEYRIDLASEKIFGKDSDLKKNDQIVTAELNYTF
jgi:hypothetical protein